jgi:hypothetical protein
VPGTDTAPAPRPHSPDLEEPDVDIGDFHVPDDLSGEDIGPADLGIEIPDDLSSLDPELIQPIKVVLAGLDKSAEQFAREAAHEKLAKQERKGPLFKRIVKSVWHTMTREYQLVKETQKAKADIEENNNLRHHQGKDDTKWREDTTRRFASEYGEAMIHADAGETYHNLSDPEKAEDKNIKRMRENIENLLARYARGDIPDRANFDKAAEEMQEAWRKENISQDYIGEGKMQATNIGDMAEQVKVMLDAAEGLSAVDKELRLRAILDKTEIIVGEAKVGSNIEIEATMAERIAEKMKGVPFINENRFAKVSAFLQNPLIVGAMVAGAYALGQKGLAYLVPGLGTAIVAAASEYHATLDERDLMDRREDNDQTANEKNKRQMELEMTRLKGREVGELIDDIGSLYNEHGELNLEDAADFKRAYEIAGEIMARMHLYDLGKRVINFADESSENIASRRFDLDLALAKLEADMSLYENPEDTHTEAIAEEIDFVIGALEQEISAQDRLAKKIALNRAAFKFVTVAVTTTLTAGVAKYLPHVVEHVVDAVREYFGGTAPDMAPASVESPLTGNDVPDVSTEYGADSSQVPDVSVEYGADGTVEVPDVAVEYGATGAAPSPEVPDISTEYGRTGTVPSAEVPDVSGDYGGETKNGGEFKASETTTVNLPEGFTETTAGNQVIVTSPGGETFTAIMNPDGSLSQESVDQMQSAGYKVDVHSDIVNGPPEVKTQTVTASEFVKSHPEMKPVEVEEFMVNEKEKVSDLNELGLNNTANKDGSVTVSISGMTAEGSFNGKSGVNWHEAAKQGHMNLYISASKDSQLQCLELAFDESGKIDIPADSPARAFFDNKGNFLGGYERAAVTGDVTPDGVTHVASLATEVGKNQGTFTETVKVPTAKTVYSYTITPPNNMSEQSVTIVDAAPKVGYPFPGLPLWGRRRLGEPDKDGEDVTPMPFSPAGVGVPGSPDGPPIDDEDELRTVRAPSSSGGGGKPATSPPSTPPRAPGTGPSLSASPAPLALAASPETDTGGTPTGTQNPVGSPAAGTADDDDPIAAAFAAATAANADFDGRTQASATPTTGFPPTDNFPPESRPFIEGLKRDLRPMPAGFHFDIAGLPALTQKMVIYMVYDMMSQFPQEPGEARQSWLDRVTDKIGLAAIDGRNSLTSMPPGPVRSLFGGAFAALSKVPAGV